MIKLLLIFIAVCCSVFTNAQQEIDLSDPEKQLIIEQRIETIAENAEDEVIDFTTLFDYLSYVFDHPINLNNFKRYDELGQLNLLTDFQINALKEHIEVNGKLISIYELQAVNGYNIGVIQQILPFVKVDSDFYAPHISFSDVLKGGKSDVFIRYSRVLDEQSGYAPISDSALEASPNSRYRGSQDKLYTRYRYKFRNNVSLGVTGEKDAGEEFFKGNQNQGFDFYSAHFFLKGFSKIKALAIGDYHAQFGQGLTIWSGLAFGKSADVMASKRNAPGLRPYTSADENLFMRGAAATIQLGKFEFTAFGSRKNIDANVDFEDTTSTFDGPTVTSFQASGFHRTPGEFQDKRVLPETHIGGNASFNTGNFKIGVSGINSRYDANVQRSSTIYNQFEFNDNKNTVVGTDYNLIIRNLNLYGEVARSANGGFAQVHGALIGLDPSVAMSFVYRKYDRDFQNNLSNSFAENSRTTNEEGLMIGIRISPNKRYVFNAYMDQFKFPWMKSSIKKPGTYGHDYLAQFLYKPSKKLSMYGRVRSRNKPENTKEDIDDIDFIVGKKQTNYRYHIVYKISDAFTLKNRVEFVNVSRDEGTKDKGFLIYQDINYKPLSSNFSFSFRYALFETDSYDARVYAYENDVLYAFSIPAYYRKGIRTYITAKYRVKRGVDVWLRIANWHLNNEESIGSGNEEILGNSKTDIRAQLRIQF